MAKMEEFVSDRKQSSEDIKVIVDYIVAGVEQMAEFKEKLNYPFTDEGVNSVLKVARGKLASSIKDMTDLLGIIEKMQNDEHYLENAEPEDIEEELEDF